MSLARDLVQIGFTSKEAEFLGDDTEMLITLTGTTQNDAYQLTKSINEFGAGTGGVADSAKLPDIVTYKKSFLIVKSNYIGFSANIFPASGQIINGLAANASIALAAGAGLLFVKADTTNKIWLAF